MQKEQIYQIMNGNVDQREAGLPENQIVANEFGEGRECGKLYDRVYAAKIRLSERLNVNEDRDVEEIINCMGSISKILALKMYDYGSVISGTLQDGMGRQEIPCLRK